VTAIGGVFQIDEQGGVSLAAELPGADLDGIAFSPDHEVMYADVPSGIILRSVRQPDGHWEPLAPFATVPFDAFELVFDIADGMVTDVCGNLYVVGMHGALLRFTPDGALDGVTSLPVAPYELFSAVRFGLGTGGFDAETAYVTSLQGAVIEVPLGVRGTPR
jgi:sugar lactone lactonase YvrE